jgi:hypothetical protein
MNPKQTRVITLTGDPYDFSLKCDASPELCRSFSQSSIPIHNNGFQTYYAVHRWDPQRAQGICHARGTQSRLWA